MRMETPGTSHGLEQSTVIDVSGGLGPKPYRLVVDHVGLGMRMETPGTSHGLEQSTVIDVSGGLGPKLYRFQPSTQTHKMLKNLTS